MWTAAASGTCNASRHHIQEGVHLSKVTLKFVDPFDVTGFVVSGAGPLERNGLIGGDCSFRTLRTLRFASPCSSQFHVISVSLSILYIEISASGEDRAPY